MHTLAIDCATEACSVALFAESKLIASDFRVLGRGHAEQLVPMIASLPGKGRAERILVSMGPGSFTGVRIGIATARALGVAWDVEVAGYPTLALVGAMALADDRNGADRVTVCMKGGHGEWFLQDFTIGGIPLSELASLSPQAAKDRATMPLVAGSQATELAALLPGDHRAAAILPDAARTVLLDPDTLSARMTPIYGRGPDARLPG